MKNGIKDFPANLIELEYTNGTGSTISAGSLVQTPQGWGVAHEDIPDTTTGILYRAGRYEYAKETGVAVVQGQPVFWDTGNTRLTPTPTGAAPAGTSPKDYASGATTMEVDINVASTPAGIRHTVDSTEAAANSNDGQVDIDTGLGVVPTTVHPTVRTASTNIIKSGYTMVPLTGNDAGKVRIGGVAAGTQIDENDIIELVVIP